MAISGATEQIDATHLSALQREERFVYREIHSLWRG
jgi:hypothetical protein